MRKKTAVLSIVILAVFSSLAFAGVPLYKHSRASKSDDDHRKPSECQYERVYHDDDGGSDSDSSSQRRNDSDEECDG